MIQNRLNRKSGAYDYATGKHACRPLTTIRRGPARQDRGAGRGSDGGVLSRVCPAGLRVCITSARPTGDAEDVVIDTMYEVWHSAGRFRGDSMVRTWLFSIARHRMLDLLRKRGPEASVDPQELADEFVADDQSSFEALVQQQRADTSNIACSA